jgi:hypothetical protein
MLLILLHSVFELPTVTPITIKKKKKKTKEKSQVMHAKNGLEVQHPNNCHLLVIVSSPASVPQYLPVVRLRSHPGFHARKLRHH